MPGTLKVKKLSVIILLLFCSAFVQAQGNRNKPIAQKKDSLATPLLTLITDCSKGIHSLQILLPAPDSLTTPPQYIQLYSDVDTEPANDSVLDASHITDTIELVQTYTIKDIEKTEGRLYPETEGVYYIRTAIRKADKWEFSLYTPPVRLHYCSIVNFPSIFELSKNKAYTPTLINIQVVEFYIFDRVGETVYTHKNNNINWNGKYPSGSECAEGIYYFHCEYIDIANEGKNQSVSGMIDLKK